MKKYDHKKIERKWQKYWKDKEIYKTKEGGKKPKCYILDMFPYLSGEGLHVGHPRGYIATDVYSRFKRMNGFNVLHPMGFDSFGLPAENYAIKNKIHPEIAVKNNVKKFKKQLELIGFDYDWDREIITSDPNFYKWTQWIFLKMFEKGLAYESYEPINFCPSCLTGLANEDVEEGKCERCGTPVIKKPMRQWVLKITDYAERMLEDLKELKGWPEHIKEAQRNWIGKSEGTTVKFPISNFQFPIEVFTTRIDTIFGVTYLVLAPENVAISNLKSKISNLEEVEKYIEEAKNKSELQRTDLAKGKTGVELKGIKAVNPFNNEEMPIFVADYVLGGYGTGAVMAVPAHDERDWEFAKKYNLPVKMVVCPNYPKPICPVLENAYTGEGHLVGSGEFNGIKSSEAREKMTKWLEEKKLGSRKINYKLKDWVFSRQRYWGEPIPLIHCENCGVVPVPEKDLPVKLPKVKFYEPTDTGESPLAKIEKWVNVKCPKCGGEGKRETNTMPQWAGSSWYYLAYIVKENSKFKIKNSKLLNKWMPVDMYVGGTEHATRHLIYARFWHKFLYDIGIVGGKEPFAGLKNQGLIMGSDGRKMSKRWGNIVNPDDVVKEYGADSLRLYEMFMGPFDQPIPWDTRNIIGVKRFLERVCSLSIKIKNKKSKIKIKDKNLKLERLVHQTIKKVSEDIENFHFNTAISALMILLNEMEKQDSLKIEDYKLLIKLLSPFAPHIAEELWFDINGKKSIHLEKWPVFDVSKTVENSFKLIVQINGKARDIFEVPAGISEDEAK
ncbi:MAG: Leucine-tRNA ligase, partial [Parcubacteria group bacterium GW2011_GWB1_43_8]